MTRTELENRINQLENDEFLLAMKDFWTDKDFEDNKRMFTELKSLREMLSKMQ
jgi:hypothetical protein